MPPDEVSAAKYFLNDEYDWRRMPPEWSADIRDWDTLEDISKCTQFIIPTNLPEAEQDRLKRRSALAKEAADSLDDEVRSKFNAEKKNAAKAAQVGVVRQTNKEISISSGERHLAVGKIANVLGSSGLYFNRGGQLARLLTLPEEVEANGTTRAAGAIIIKAAEVAAIVSDVSKFATIKKWDGRIKGFVECDLPKDVAQSVVALGVEDQSVRPLKGIVYVPILRPDGSIVSDRGYDRQTQLYLAAQVDLDVAENPTHQQACDAAAWLMEEIYGEFKTDEIGRSIMLSSLITSLVRPYISGAPLHCFDAPQYGAGKSMLAEIPGIVATGVKPAMTSGGNADELTKKVESAIRSGDSINVLDNLSQPLTGDSLCVLLTAELVSIRIFGQNLNVQLRTSAFWMATGQNLIVSADMVRRAVICRIDPGVERPELGEFKKNDLIRWVKTHRMDILSRLYIILRAHAQAGFPHGDGVAPKLGSFSEWARRVAGLCTWLGYVSPLGSQEKMYDEDPVRGRRSSALDAIYEWQDGDRSWPANELLKAIQDIADGVSGHQGLYDFAKNEFSRFKPSEITAVALAGWFRRVKDQVTGGKKLVQIGHNKETKAKLWCVVAVGPTAATDLPEWTEPV